MNILQNRAVLIAGVCLSAVSLWAQDNRATLGGRVIDQQEAAVPNAQVVVTAEATQTQQKTTTNNVGEWKILFLNPGRYSISVQADGFKVAERSNIELQTGDIKQIDIKLALGATAETVTVNADVPLIDTTSATSGTVISTQEI